LGISGSLSLRRFQLSKPLGFFILVTDVQDIGIVIALSIAINGLDSALVLCAIFLEDRSAVVADGPLLFRHSANLLELRLSRRGPPRWLEILERFCLVGAVADERDAAERLPLCVRLDGVNSGLEDLAVGEAHCAAKTTGLPRGRGISRKDARLESLLLIVEDLEAEAAAAVDPFPDLRYVEIGVALEARGL